MSEFRFSPRRNRANEIAWMPWGTEAFDRARRDDKPILLSISAVWCHWCHVMDETSYSDPGVIAAINERFVPIRVDNDRRPDINARYNMGGWPTTAFLAPDGSTLTGATYLPPEQMRRALDEIARFYAENKAGIAERIAQTRPRRSDDAGMSSGELRDSMIVRLVKEITETYDETYGGFGEAPKFPQPELLEFLVSEWRVSGDERLYRMVATTMLGMARGGMYDRVEGGFFRYSTTRDWSVPHFEKMAEDHGGLIRVLAQLAVFAPTQDFHATLRSATHYVRNVLRDPATGFFAGSQDADEAYFELPLEERQRRGAPFVDRTSYTNWTCALGGAWFLASRALDDDTMVREGCQTLDSVHERLLDSDGLVHHFVAEDGTPQIRGLLTDQVAYLRALADAHETSGEPRFLQRALALATGILERFAAPGGGFYDHRTVEPQLGRLEHLDRPIGDNAILSETLVRLSALATQPQFRPPAERALGLYARTYAAAGSFAAAYGRAVRRLLSPERTVRIVGDPAATGDMREAAFRLPSPHVAIRTVRPADAVTLDLPADPHPAAYVCAGTACGAPVTHAADLRSAYDRLEPAATR